MIADELRIAVLVSFELVALGLGLSALVRYPRLGNYYGAVAIYLVGWALGFLVFAGYVGTIGTANVAVASFLVATCLFLVLSPTARRVRRESGRE